jgi:hypothetical protein
MTWLTHGHTSAAKTGRVRGKTTTYRIWSQMRQRCNCPQDRSYPAYGGRGIRVCDEWNASFEAFLRDMGERPSRMHSIDRINNDGHYEPANCRWATAKEQRANQRPTGPTGPRPHLWKAVCGRGHQLSGDNLSLIGRRRICKACNRIRTAAYAQRRRAA